MNSDKKMVSIVIPVYYNSESIPYMVTRLQGLKKTNPNYLFEFIFVDDGSKDNSLELLLNAKKTEESIKIIKLTRNFGIPSGFQAGLKYAKGDCVGVVAADLQDPPELFNDMIKEWELGKKVVMAVREDRDESGLQKIVSNTFYYFLNKFALEGYPKQGFDLVLIDRQVVKLFNEIDEKNLHPTCLLFWFGFDRKEIGYVRQKRVYGVSKFSFFKKIKLTIDSFIGFSYAPIRIMSLLGFIIAFVGFVYVIVILINAMFGKIPVRGWATMISILTFLHGITLMMIGILGEYIWRILSEARNRPSYIIDKIYD
jgi:polyisoprenyl-phosphate glycosyltransferase